MEPDVFSKQILLKVIDGEDLTQDEITRFMDAVLSGTVNPEKLAGLLCCLKMKGETRDEVLGLILAMRQKMLTVKGAENAVDVCGTGGDQSGTFNISTTVAFVVAGAGAKVAKHGNRAASSQSGSADVLEALGVNIQLSPEQAEAVFKKIGLVFLFAPAYHPAMKYVVPVRKALAIPTIFNKLGPFSNPAGVQRQLIGIPDLKAAKLLASVAKQLPHRRILIATSHDGLDEVSTVAPTTLIRVEDGRAVRRVIQPSDYGIATTSIESLRGGDAQRNAEILHQVLDGVKGPHRDIVVLNAGCALYAAGVTTTIDDGIKRAMMAIDDGRALKMLKKLLRETGKYA